ncbi:MAG: hypothetical protein M3065_16870 [Actinomycetota bacterium]|nr:hypothetical protein [Actinomycetota bacterium]
MKSAHRTPQPSALLLNHDLPQQLKEQIRLTIKRIDGDERRSATGGPGGPGGP